ncbi:hypothetical protein HZD82_23110, partial [Pantoea agglomerans]|uniref:hypothetical protein n=1 Tax=Enterobacter agglomerans TaxID=549 RepID=UPI001A8E0413
YIWAKRYLDHHDDEFIRRCERVRGQFMLTSALCGLVVISLAVDLVASQLVMNYWFPDTPGWIWSALFLGLMFLLNYISVK